MTADQIRRDPEQPAALRTDRRIETLMLTQSDLEDLTHHIQSVVAAEATRDVAVHRVHMSVEETSRIGIAHTTLLPAAPEEFRSPTNSDDQPLPALRPAERRP